MVVLSGHMLLSLYTSVAVTYGPTMQYPLLMETLLLLQLIGRIFAPHGIYWCLVVLVTHVTLGNHRISELLY